VLTPGWLVDRRVRRLTARGQHKVGVVLDAVERAEALDAAIQDVAVRRAEERPAPPGSRRERRLRSVGIGLTAVNAAAVVAMLALPGAGGRLAAPVEIGVAVLLGVLVGGGQIAFAAAVGRRLQEARLATAGAPHPRGRRLERSVPFEGAALALLGTLMGWVVYVWTQGRVEDAGSGLGEVLGVALALQAWIAPWLVVAETAAARPTGSSRTDLLDRRLRALVVDRELDRSTAALALVSARSALHSAQRRVARSVELGGRPSRAGRSHLLRQLAEATAEAEARYTALIAFSDDGSSSEPPDGPLGRSGVDLVG
jgi:hypothetical protein